MTKPLLHLYIMTTSLGVSVISLYVTAWSGKKDIQMNFEKKLESEITNV